MKRDRLRWLTARPIAHRGYHNLARGRPENSIAAFEAAIASHYAIECDLHPTADGVPMVFHDLSLKRLTGDQRAIRDVTLDALRGLRLAGTPEWIPTLDELLSLVGGRVPLALELKHVRGRDGTFSWQVAESLRHYAGPVAVMSYSAAQLTELRTANARLPQGLVAKGNYRRALANWRKVRRLEVDFVTYRVGDLPTPMPIVARRLFGIPVICWTVRTREQMVEALRWTDQVTFEGFAP